MAVVTIFSLPNEVLSTRIFLLLPTTDLRTTSLVSKFFNEFFHEHLPWQDLFRTRPLPSTVLYAPLKNACNRGYLQFVRTCFCITEIEQPDLKQLVNWSVGNKNIEAYKAFIESGRFSPHNRFWMESLRIAFVDCQEEFITIFVNNPWENAVIRHSMPTGTPQWWAAQLTQETGRSCLSVMQKKESLNLLEKFDCIEKGHSHTRDLLLKKAVELGNAEIVQTTLQYCSHDAISNACEQSAILGHNSIITVFIDQNVYSDKALPAAAENNRLATLQLLVSRKCCSPRGLGQALIIAAQKGHQEIVEYLIDLNQHLPETHDLALKGAARANHLPIVQLFITRKLCEKPASLVACQEAVGEGHVEIVRAFLEIECCEKPEALKLAAKKGRLEVLRLLNPVNFEKILLQDVLKEAVSHNQPKIVSAFIENKWVATIPIDLIFPPIQKGFPEVVSLLFNSPSFEKLLDLDFHAMLLNAITFKHLSVIQILINSKHFRESKINTLQDMAASPVSKPLLNDLIKQAAKTGCLEIVKASKPLWFSEPIRNQSLEKAIKFNHLKIVEFFIQNHWCRAVTADLMILPLQKGFDEIVHLFLASPFALDMALSDYYSLLYHTVKFERLSILQTLLTNPRFEDVDTVHLKLLFDLAKTKTNPGIKTNLLISSRGYELSEYFLVRFFGRALLLSRRLFAWFYSLGTARRL